LILMPVDHLEQRRERGAELETQPTPVADIKDASEFSAQVRLVEIRRVLRVVDDVQWIYSSTGLQRFESLAEATGVALLGAGKRLEPIGDLG
jgi:hypothetical protein